MPLFADAERIIRANLLGISQGVKVPLVVIGEFTEKQYDDINAVRRGLDLHELRDNEIVFIGKHIYVRRTYQGYTIDDMVLQISSAMSASSLALVNPRMSALRSTIIRDDGYGKNVLDQAIFEMTNRKPRAELYSVIPKGDGRTG